MNVDILIVAEVLGALGVIGAFVMGIVKFTQKVTSMDNKLDGIMEELYYITKGTLASLKGLKEQGCDGPVTESLDELEEHINRKAHK